MFILCVIKGRPSLNGPVNPVKRVPEEGNCDGLYAAMGSEKVSRALNPIETLSLSRSVESCCEGRNRRTRPTGKTTVNDFTLMGSHSLVLCLRFESGGKQKR